MQVELWDTNHSLVLTLPHGASPEPFDLEAEFKACSADPFKAAGPMRVVRDTIAATGVAAVRDDSGKPIGYLVRWRRTSLNPPPKQLTDLLGSEAALYFGNIQGNLFTNLERVVSKPRADLGSTGQVMQYSRDGNRALALGRPINGTPWFLAIEFPEQPLLAPAHRFLRRILLADLVVFIIGMAGAFVLSRGITQPLEVLTEAASAIGAGDYSNTVDIHREDELGALANAFNAMVTARKRAEEDRKRFFELSQDLLCILGFDGYFTDVNPAWEKTLGYTRAELLATPFIEFIHPDDREVTPAEAEKVSSGETLRAIENRYRCKDGSYRLFQWSVTPVIEDRVMYGVARDITERKQAERTSIQLAAIVDSSDDAIIGKDLDGIITSWNKGAEKIFGYTAGEMVGTSIMQLIPADRQHEENQILRKIRRAESVEHFETLRLTKDGRLIDISITASPIKDVTGKVTGVSKVARCITERKAAEAAVCQSEARYRTLFDTLIEGFCTIEMIFDAGGKPVDYRFLEINPAFEKQTGLQNAQGRLMRELAPNLEEHWFEIYGEIALTGEPRHFENEAKALGRHYDVCAYRVGGPESRKVAILFNDITERKRTEAQIHLLNAATIVGRCSQLISESIITIGGWANQLWQMPRWAKRVR